MAGFSALKLTRSLMLPIHVSGCDRALPELRYGWGVFDGIINKRTRVVVSKDNDDLFLFVNSGGAFAASQRGRETEIGVYHCLRRQLPPAKHRRKGAAIRVTFGAVARSQAAQRSLHFVPTAPGVWRRTRPALISSVDSLLKAPLHRRAVLRETRYVRVSVEDVSKRGFQRIEPAFILSPQLRRVG